MARGNTHVTLWGWEHGFWGQAGLGALPTARLPDGRPTATAPHPAIHLCTVWPWRRVRGVPRLGAPGRLDPGLATLTVPGPAAIPTPQVCRRAERSVVVLSRRQVVSGEVGLGASVRQPLFLASLKRVCCTPNATVTRR